jgi:hypothetical protein
VLKLAGVDSQATPKSEPPAKRGAAK